MIDLNLNALLFRGSPSTPLRKNLTTEHMEFFMEFNKRDDMLMTQGWPAGYMRTMLQRAHEAQYRLLGVKRDHRDDRVIRVDFGRRSA